MRKLGLVLAAIILGATTLPAEAQSDLETARADVEEIAGRMAKTQARADEATARLNEAEGAVELTQVRIDDLAVELELSSADLEALREQIRSFAVSRYTGEAVVFQPFETEEINDYTVASSLARFAQLDTSDVVDDYRVSEDRLDAATEALLETELEQEVALEKFSKARAEIDEELAVLAADSDQLEAVLSRLEAEDRARIEAEVEAARRAAEQAEAARAATSTTTPDPDESTDGEDEDSTSEPEPEPEAPTTPIASGSWICPVQGPVSFVDSWGDPRSGGRSHQGVDMMAASGTPVVAPVSGTVEHRGNSLGGLSFHLAGNDGNYYYGTHLSGYGNSGSVEAGVVIGYVGSTGNASTSHLHFEIHQGVYGNAVNPYQTVAAAC